MLSDLFPLPRAAFAPVQGAAGLLRAGFADPGLVAAGAMAFLRWGTSPATAYAAAARRHPRRPAIIDEGGSVTYAELDGRTNAIANGLAPSIGPGSVVGLLARNGRAFVEAHLALAKLGADVVLLNTGFAPPQLADVCAREGIGALVVDPALVPATAALPAGTPQRFTTDELAAMATTHAHRPPPRPGREPRIVLLTSGTTGTPKGAQRARTPRDPRGLAALVAAIPFRPDDVVAVTAPLFHAWGFTQYVLAGSRGATLVLRAGFDPLETVHDLATHRVTVLAVVPVMLQRILALGHDVIDAHDHRSLRVVASSGSALPGRLATEWMAAFGDNLYNLYGSTEVGHATVASPADLHAAPGTAGRPMPGVTVRILDDDGRPLPDGKVGRIFVGSPFRFDGYTGGGSKATVGSLMATGDLGSFDKRGRLYVGGRDDDMIVSGGENVFPREVEDLLMQHPAVADAAVVGVPDEAFGQRLVAFVVRRPTATGQPELDAEQVRSHVRDRLARHKVPRDVTFVDALPRNATGKILRTRLTDPA